jgi:membrane-associated phospholipid phosphatase
MLTLLSKLWFYADGGSLDFNILSPSAHVSLSVTFYGCVAIILASQRRLTKRAGIIAAAILAVIAIGASRVALEMHTPEEVLFGGLVGGLCVAV